MTDLNNEEGGVLNTEDHALLNQSEQSVDIDEDEIHMKMDEPLPTQPLTMAAGAGMAKN